MGKPFAERLATGLKTHAQNCETLRDLIAETNAERDRQLNIERCAEADSVDATLNESDCEEAANRAARARRLAKGYADAITTLQAKLSAKLASDQRKALECEREAALAERNDIAGRFRQEVPAAVQTLAALFAEVEANSHRLKAAGVHERDAEAEARGVPGNYSHGSVLIDQFTKMKIPNWLGSGRAWPIDPTMAVRARLAEAERRQQLSYARSKSPEARAEAAAKAAKAKADEALLWPSYSVSHTRNALILVEHRLGQSSLDAGDRVILQMNAEQVEKARALGIRVEPSDPAGSDSSNTHASACSWSESF